MRPLDRLARLIDARPGELPAALDAQSKYKAKNVIDTLVYRGGDVASAWLKSGLDTLGHGPLPVALEGAACAALWGWRLGSRADALSESQQ